MKRLWVLSGILAAVACAPAPAPTRSPYPAGVSTPSASASAMSSSTAAPSEGPSSSEFLSTEPIEPIVAPFAMPALQRPVFPRGVFSIAEYGAVADGHSKNTAAFQRAVAAATSQGGGTVLVPQGRWLTGPVHLASNINLHLQAGAEVLFSQDFGDYLPPVFTRWEGLEVYNYSPLVYAKDCENVAITGAGTLNGQGAAWWPWKKTQSEAAKRLYELASNNVPVSERVFGVEGGLRPSFVQTVGCKNVLIEGVTITNGPMWTIHPIYSENIIVRRVKIVTEGPNNDGFNPDSSRNVLVEDAWFDTGDDCVVLKSGLNEDGWRVGRPTENVVVRRVRGARGHGGVVIGSEMSGGVRNVYVNDCDFKGTDRGLRIKSMRGRGGVVENITYENVRHEDLRLMAVELTTFYQSSTLLPKTTTPPTIRNITVRNITTHGAQRAIDIVGLPELPIQDVLISDVEIHSDTGVRCIDCRGVRFERAKIMPASGKPFSVENGQEIRIDESCQKPQDCLQLNGAANRAVTVDGRPVP